MTADKPQIVRLTPNCSTVAVGLGDAINSTFVEIMLQDIVCRSVTVSVASAEWVLSDDYDKCPPLILKKGLKITYVSPSGAAYYVLLSGTIVDTEQEYAFVDLVIYMSAGVEAATVPDEKA
jgi:hypothetical protein